MKRSPIMRIATIAMAVCLIMSCAVFGSVAKYTSSAAGTDTVKVAKWSFNVEETDIAVSDEFAMNLFADELIAPGAEGEFVLDIKNASEVTANYSVDLEITNEGNVPLQFKVDDGDWETDIANLEAKLTAELAVGDAAEHTISWKWVSVSDEADTDIGKAAPSVIVTAVVTAEQAN